VQIGTRHAMMLILKIVMKHESKPFLMQPKLGLDSGYNFSLHRIQIFKQ
jgi:hypothetical protein